LRDAAFQVGSALR
jgi:hypothetical protein